jgi:hypothetical protein
MFPISADKLSFLKIADYWSRESRASQDELLAELEAAWWRGQIAGNSARTRLEVLRSMYDSRHDLQSVVFVTPNDPGPQTETPLPGGGFVVDLAPRISVPNETDDWTENSCNDAFEELAQLPSQQYFRLFSYSICYIELTPEEFFGWIRSGGFDVPTFWKTIEPLSAREIARKEEQKPAAKPSLKRELKAAYKERIETYRGKEPPSRTDDEQWAKENFLTRTKARDLRRELAPPEWRKPGRRKCKDKINLA